MARGRREPGPGGIKPFIREYSAAFSARAAGTTIATLRRRTLEVIGTSTRIKALAFVAAVSVAATLIPDQADAQGRRGHVVRPRGGVVVAGYYRPIFYDPFFYDPWFYPYRYGWYPPFPYGYGQFYDASSSLRLQVSPRETEVFIDGYYAGTVDDFDGFFQRLRLEPGEHEVQLYLEGHRTVRQKVYLQPTGTFRLKHTMQPLAAGDTPEPRPVPPAGPPPQTGRYDAFGRRDRSERPEPPQPPDRPDASSRDTEFGALAIRVQPAGAEVIVDGERWDGPDTSDRLVVQLPEGQHRVEVRRDGFSTYSSTVQVRRGETTTLNISLVRE